VGKDASRAFRSASLKRFKSIPKSIDLLEMFNNLPMGIISNGQRVYSAEEVKKLNLNSYFGFIIFSSDMGFRKPDHRIFHEGARRLAMKPEEILFIGDSWDADINPARAMGMKAIHVQEAWGFL
jgi:putative hydrolase of the HAD superfamily